MPLVRNEAQTSALDSRALRKVNILHAELEADSVTLEHFVLGDETHELFDIDNSAFRLLQWSSQLRAQPALTGTQWCLLIQ